MQGVESAMLRRRLAEGIDRRISRIGRDLIDGPNGCHNRAKRGREDDVDEEQRLSRGLKLVHWRRFGRPPSGPKGNCSIPPFRPRTRSE